MKKTLVVLLVLLAALSFQGHNPDFACAAHAHLEKEYQDVWCNQNSGQLEYRLDDLTRVDCLTDEYAIEFDFAPKWAESVGQALYYAAKTGKAPGVVMIVEKDTDRKHLKKIRVLADKYGIKLWEMVPGDVE